LGKGNYIPLPVEIVTREGKKRKRGGKGNVSLVRGLRKENSLVRRIQGEKGKRWGEIRVESPLVSLGESTTEREKRGKEEDAAWRGKQLALAGQPL